jgi:drug/metabolite transporter (DMT)-like permease
MKLNWSETGGYLFIILASCFFGISASLGKALMQQDVSTIMLMQTRSVVTGLVLLPSLLLIGRKHLQVARKDWLWFVLLAVPGIALVNASYYYAVKLLTIALAVFLQFTAPLLVFLYGWATKKERVTKDKTLALLFSMIGTYLMVKLHGSTGSNISLVGVVSAIISTIAYAFYVILSHELGKKYSPWTLICFGYSLAGIFWCLIQNPFQTAAILTKDHLWKEAILFSFCSTLIPFTLFLMGLRRVSPTGATIASTTETISASLFAYFFLGEALTTGQIAGGALIVSAIFLLAYTRVEKPKELSLTA